ncbi:hypothetical protein FS837_004912 [Tulasnella sp. UAMH 9824]|nr:hypothetical protein FS837_004912 [Tulasnella sp. UAMH 9824]
MFEDTASDLRGLVRYRSLNTFKLDGVEAGHFSLFLSALHARSEFNFSLDDLKAILALASDWGFSELRNRCINNIKKLRPPPVDQVILARRSQIPQWTREAYLTLAVRTPRLTIADAGALGSTATAIIARAREEILLHRLQAFTLMDGSSRSLPCKSPSRACREVLCEVRLALMTEKRYLRKTNKARSDLFSKEVSNLGQELCDACKSEEALGCIIRALDQEIDVAKKVLKEELGADDSWIARDLVKNPL